MPRPGNSDPGTGIRKTNEKHVNRNFFPGGVKKNAPGDASKWKRRKLIKGVSTSMPINMDYFTNS
jgi:hypothetical protein